MNEDETMTTMSNDDVTASAATVGRRRVLFAGGGAVAAGLVIAACGDDDGGAADTSGDSEATTTTAGGGGGDLETAMFAASLEVLAVNTYQAALDAANDGALGEVPPAVAEFVTVARDQHQIALESWNEIVTAAGEDEVTEPPAELEQTVNDQFSEVSDVTGAAELALLLEQTAGATYLAAVPTLESEDAIRLAGALDYVDQQHAAVLLFVLGRYPVPEVFQSTEMAATPG